MVDTPKTPKDERADYVSMFPIDPLGANDPAIIESFPEHCKYIGYIVAEWSHIEYNLIGILTIAMEVQSAGAVQAMMYSLESSGARLGIFEAAFPFFFEGERKEEALSIIEEAKSLLIQRNKFAHSVYGENERGMAIIGMKRSHAVDLPLHDLKHQFQRMRALSFRVGRLFAQQCDMWSEQPSEQHGLDVLRKLETSLSDDQSRPVYPKQPKPSGQ
jgi:hypothetical protein